MTDPMMRRPLFSRGQRHAFTALICMLSAGLSSASHADEMLHWKDAWVRSMPPGAQVSAAYGMLMNHGDQTVTLSAVSSEISSTAEMHEVIADGDQRRMAELESIDIVGSGVGRSGDGCRSRRSRLHDRLDARAHALPSTRRQLQLQGASARSLSR